MQRHGDRAEPARERGPRGQAEVRVDDVVAGAVPAARAQGGRRAQVAARTGGEGEHVELDVVAPAQRRHLVAHEAAERRPGGGGPHVRDDERAHLPRAYGAAAARPPPRAPAPTTAPPHRARRTSGTDSSHPRVEPSRPPRETRPHHPAARPGAAGTGPARRRHGGCDDALRDDGTRCTRRRPHATAGPAASAARGRSSTSASSCSSRSSSPASSRPPTARSTAASRTRSSRSSRRRSTTSAARSDRPRRGGCTPAALGAAREACQTGPMPRATTASTVPGGDPRRRPIGVFDSGVGGLTVLHELLVALPHEDFVYLGDTARFPYGDRAPEELEGFALEIASALAARGAKLLVVACNSATAAALPALLEHHGPRGSEDGLDVLGVVHPESQAAVVATRTGRIGLLATPATVASGAYERALHAADPHVRLTSVPCPDLAPIIQGGLPVRPARRRHGARLLRPAARRPRGHRHPRLHALPARAAHAPAHARARRHARHPGVGHRPPGRVRARRARPLVPRGGRGRLPLPLHGRAGELPRARHPLPADAARRDRPRGSRPRPGGVAATAVRA